jgi:L-seryl-tRNA(Ser) seleniumtransferase
VKQLKSVDGTQVSLVDSVAQTGSGALPLEEIPSVAVAIFCEGVDHLAAPLRKNDPPIVGYVRDDRLLLDVRTLWPDDLKVIVNAFENAIQAD